jgi:hypothetical protein
MELYTSLILEDKAEPESLLKYVMYRMITNSVLQKQHKSSGVNYIPLRYAEPEPLTAAYLPTENGCDAN